MREPNRWGIVILLSLAVATSACTFTRQKINVEGFHEKAHLVVPGETTAEELPAIFGGPPNALINIGLGRKLLIYTFGDSKTAGLTLIVLNIRKTNTGVDSAYFFIDAEGVIEEVVVSNNSAELDWDWWAFGG